MSTTDTRAAFEAWAKTHPEGVYYTNHYGCFGNVMQVTYDIKAEAAWQAATEAAKATGTAVEPKLPKPIAQIGRFMDESTDVFDGSQMRAYGQACAKAARSMAVSQADYNHDMDELSQDFEPVGDLDLERAKRHIVGLRKRLKNANARAEAARQPAPVAAQENGGLVRAALIDLMEVEQAATAGEFKQDKTFDFAKQSHYRALFARARAALAATAAPVLSDEQRKQINFAVEVLLLKGCNTDADNLRAILAATRSQP